MSRCTQKKKLISIEANGIQFDFANGYLHMTPSISIINHEWKVHRFTYTMIRHSSVVLKKAKCVKFMGSNKLPLNHKSEMNST